MTSTIAPTHIQPLKTRDDDPQPLSFDSFDLPASNQRVLGAPHPPNTVTPLALRPSTENPDLATVVETIRSLQSTDTLTTLLARHGTLLFRGLPIHSASDFSTFAHAFTYKPHEIIGIVVNRPLLAPNVAPANEAPKEVLIYSHNESPQVPHAPEYIFFYGHRVPDIGGESPISSSLELFQRVREEIPEFVATLAEKGVLSKVTYKVSTQYAGGSTLKQAFGKNIVEGDDAATQREKIEAQIRRYGRGEHTTWEWQDDDTTLVLTHRLPAIRTQPGTNLPTLFTGLAAYWKNLQINTEISNARKASAVQYYGDGTPIPDVYSETLARITDEIRVLHKWERGDVLVYDNVIAQHGRQPWGGEQEDRVILASLWDSVVPGQYEGSKGDWAQVVQASEG
ncbi:hypothetical protein B0J11DRAFT_141252 [Dendryphion nanum]|uniref:TauD/TfdA-like domain-containing protein n=1 Tax=Dendryphion nanum TaxID=256645 RepID=A0A9P9D762_9PLEO|nr:hypothetical protein B0J11DRAFT_141252 [Dendryphion nanum]